jgi:hypothetical protein
MQSGKANNNSLALTLFELAVLCTSSIMCQGAYLAAAKPCCTRARIKASLAGSLSKCCANKCMSTHPGGSLQCTEQHRASWVRESTT